MILSKIQCVALKIWYNLAYNENLNQTSNVYLRFKVLLDLRKTDKFVQKQHSNEKLAYISLSGSVVTKICEKIATYRIIIEFQPLGPNGSADWQTNKFQSR